MVKGNWERRAEMALIRRKEAKEKKANRNRPKSVSSEAAWSKLHADEALQKSGAGITVWLEDASDDAPPVCSSWFRCEECDVKKCRLSHDQVTVAHLRNIAAEVFECDDGGSSELIRQERVCLPTKPLRDVTAREAVHIMVIAVDNTCVFDYRNPEAWTQWQASRSAAGAGAGGASRTLHTVLEEAHDGDMNENSDNNSDSDDNHDRNGGSSDDEDGDGESRTVFKMAAKLDRLAVLPGTDATSLHTSGSVSGIFTRADTGLVHGAEAIATCLFSLLDMPDLVALLQTAKALKAYCQRNELFRRRKRECLSELAHELSRQKKEEKKKRVKSANAKKTDKKDAFARGGGNGGR
jgi:hypothetical protein